LLGSGIVATAPEALAGLAGISLRRPAVVPLRRPLGLSIASTRSGRKASCALPVGAAGTHAETLRGRRLAVRGRRRVPSLSHRALARRAALGRAER
jgi:hypothetical protein